MSQQQELPLLLLPTTGVSDREKRPPGFARIHVPEATRQIERIGPKFRQLQRAFEQQSFQVQANAPNENPELVVVFETIGALDGFFNAVKRTPGLEWLLESDEVGIVPDDDFFAIDDGVRSDKALNGRLFLLGSNQQALAEIIALWDAFCANPDTKFGHGLGKWKVVFKHLRDVRFWSTRDRIGPDVQRFWLDLLASGVPTIRFEVEAWYFAAEEKNTRAATQIGNLVTALGGRILSSALIPEIAYHGFLVEMPASGVQSLLGNTPPALALSENVMFFRPQGQAIADNDSEPDALPPPIARESELPIGPAIAALLDGMPMQNHPLLAGRITVDDPDDWASTYEARDRVHGTAMASLIVHGELDSQTQPIKSPLYVRPIMRTRPTDTRTPKEEATPDNHLLLDLFHRAVKRMFEGEGSQPPTAPSVKVINVSVGDAFRPFDRELSPWARLLDWLSERYNVLFIVSAGNNDADLTLRDTPRDSIGTIRKEDLERLAVSATFSDTVNRRILSPAESLNALTIGALHADAAVFPQVPNRYDVFATDFVAPYSRVGHGYRRAIKPELLLPGGRILYRERLGGSAESTQLAALRSPAAPGHKVATPPGPGGENTVYTRGTSNATALATRWAVQAHAVIESLRADDARQIPQRYDAVLMKALLAHGAEWGNLEQRLLATRPELTDWQKQKEFVSRAVGYGKANIARALSCTEQRATLVGMGEIAEGQGVEFRTPLPPSLVAQTVRRRLTITLAWISPTNPRHAKYRGARLWIDPPGDQFEANRTNCHWQHVQRGTLQHEILEGETALAFVDGTELLFKVNCASDAGRLMRPVKFALCVSVEVAPEVGLPIYQEIRDRIQPQVRVNP